MRFEHGRNIRTQKCHTVARHHSGSLEGRRAAIDPLAQLPIRIACVLIDNSGFVGKDIRTPH